ncbi:MAG: CHAT domain-containing protein [Rhodocyclaceae bacterium]|nr:CHAT domain-containing protein [Rhodocyclaceae bacterium]
MDVLQRATQLLRPFMNEERRDTWLMLAFRSEHPDIYDAIPRSGATADFTVRCVSRLLDRGCLVSRHALSVLLEVVRSAAGDDRQEAFQTLIKELDAKCTGTVSPTIRRAAQPPATGTTPTTGALMSSQSTILFLAASPEGEEKLALDVEAREIEEKIQQADHRDSLIFTTKWAIRPDDLLNQLNKLKPQAVHFSAHGTANELILNDENGQPKPVSGKAIRALFDLHKRTVRLVVLNACYTKKQAKGIVEVIDCAIGMKKEIGDKAAIAFAAAFYRKLGFGASVKEAFDEGCVALMLADIPEEKTPELLVRNGVDAAQVFLVGPEANPS